MGGQEVHCCREVSGTRKKDFEGREERDQNRGEAWRDSIRGGQVTSKPQAISFTISFYFSWILPCVQYRVNSINTGEFVHVRILFSHLAHHVLFLLPLFILAPFVSLPLISFSLASYGILPPTLYFFSCCAFSSAMLTHSFLPCISLPFSLLPPPHPAAHCLQAAEEAFSPSPCPESIYGFGSSFSPPFCARTSVSSRRLRQVGPAWIPGPGFPWTSCCSVTLPLHSASPCACIHRDRAWSCISLFWDRVVRKPPLVSASEGGSLEEGAMSEGKVRREFLGVLYYTWIPHRLCPPQGS